MLKGQELHNSVQKACNSFLLGRFGVGWHDLSDSVSIWDWIDEDMDDDTIKDVAKDCCWDRLYDGGMDRDLATETIYGKEAL